MSQAGEVVAEEHHVVEGAAEVGELGDVLGRQLRGPAAEACGLHRHAGEDVERQGAADGLLDGVLARSRRW